MNSSRKEDEKGRRKPTQIIFFLSNFFLIYFRNKLSYSFKGRTNRLVSAPGKWEIATKGCRESWVMLDPTCFPHKFIHPQKTAPGLPPNNMKPGPRAQQICGILSPFVDPNREGSCIPQPHLGFTSLLLGFKGVPNARPIARAFW